MIKKLFYIASLLNVAQLIFCSYLAVKECDYVLISCIAIIAGIFVQVGLYIHYKYLQNRDVTIQTPPNGETPGTLGRIFGIGVLLIG